ncbi:hypothetical protein BC834DRAFT_970547 [Gloeopeniophorella convolvens]|nr:hypothetical protein BC834DRAFT_970547 [Gloeopeniophorella convolvens]
MAGVNAAACLELVHEVRRLGFIGLPPPEEAPRAHPEPEEDAQEEDVTEAVVGPHDEGGVADAREVAEQIARDAAEPQENAAPRHRQMYLCFPMTRFERCPPWGSHPRIHGYA